MSRCRTFVQITPGAFRALARPARPLSLNARFEILDLSRATSTPVNKILGNKKRNLLSLSEKCFSKDHERRASSREECPAENFPILILIIHSLRETSPEDGLFSATLLDFDVYVLHATKSRLTTQKFRHAGNACYAATTRVIPMMRPRRSARRQVIRNQLRACGPKGTLRRALVSGEGKRQRAGRAFLGSDDH